MVPVGVGHRERLGAGSPGCGRQVDVAGLAAATRRSRTSSPSTAAGGRRRQPGRLGPAGRLGGEHRPASAGTCRTGSARRRPPARRPGGRATSRPAHRWPGTGRRRRRRRAPPGRCTWPGVGRLEQRREQQGRAGRRRCCRRWRRGRRRARPADAQLLGERPRGPAVRGRRWRRGRRRSATNPAAFSASSQAAWPSGDVAGLAEALLPRASSGHRPACASGRGTPRWPSPPPSNSASTGPSASSPTSSAAAPSPPATRRPSRPDRCAGRRRRPAWAPPPAQRGAQRARSPSAPRRRRRRPATSGPSRRAAWTVGGVRLVDVGRRRRWRTTSVCDVDPPSATAAPAGPPPRPSWWCPRRSEATVRVPLPPPVPATAAIVVRSSRRWGR